MPAGKTLVRISIAVAAIAAGAAPGVAQVQVNAVRFNRDIRPIMSGTCFRCHVPDKNSRMTGKPLDVPGVRPTPEEAAAFLKGGSPNAYEKLVDRLMASPQYAEQQAMHWLDAVRYADTCGFHGDNAFPAWPYRDYVLHAYRDNQPFDEFTREQLAGDMIPNATVEQRVASAYNRLNRTSAAGGLQPKEYLAKYAADRVRTTVAGWMGSTLGCAEGHDHKFDP